MKKPYFSHDQPRKHQEQLLKDAYKCMENSRNLICHAPTGIGKTSAVLGPAITHATENNSTIFFLTPKISQHRIAVNELKKLSEKHDLKFKATDVIGKKHMCADEILEDTDSESFYEACKRKRDNEECDYYAKTKGFTKKEKLDAKKNRQEIRKKTSNIERAQKIKKICKEHDMCPYEYTVLEANNSKAIICDYFHLLSPTVRDVFLAKVRKNLKDAIVIIDEAHNAPERIRRVMSVTLNSYMLKRALNEAKVTGSSVKKPLERLNRYFHNQGDEMDGKEKLCSKESIPLLSENQLNELKETGKTYLEATNRDKSSCLKIMKFMEEWQKDSDKHVRIMTTLNPGKYSLSYKCLDPAPAIKPVIKGARSVIAMSGTLTPQKMYEDIMGFQGAVTREYSSPFPKSNRMNIISDSTTTRYSERGEKEYSKMSGELEQVVRAISGNTAIFFPSYSVLQEVSKRLDVDSKTFVQKPRSTPEQNQEIVRRFKRNHNEGALLLAVAGGSLSEGIDYPGTEMMGVVVVGIPLQEMDLETQALVDYYEHKFGAGWSYGYLFPAMIKAIQASGRLIRNKSDKGAVMFMDKRYLWQNYLQCFPKDMQLTKAEDPAREIKEFFER